jgi:hypothetical protein
MKITKSVGTINNIPYTFVTFKPFGTFYQKINSVLKSVHHKLIIDEDSETEILSTKSKKKFKTFLPSLLKRKPKDVLMIYKYGTKNGHTYTNKKGQVKNTANDKYGQRQVTAFKIISELYSFKSDAKLTPENLVKTACQNLLDNYYAYQVSLSDESEPWPLYSITFKFLY